MAPLKHQRISLRRWINMSTKEQSLVQSTVFILDVTFPSVELSDLYKGRGDICLPLAGLYLTLAQLHLWSTSWTHHDNNPKIAAKHHVCTATSAVQSDVRLGICLIKSVSIFPCCCISQALRFLRTTSYPQKSALTSGIFLLKLQNEKLTL